MEFDVTSRPAKKKVHSQKKKKKMHGHNYVRLQANNDID